MAVLSDVVDEIKSNLVLNGTDYDTQVKSAITSTLKRLRGKKLWFLEEQGTVTLLTGFSTVAMPTDFSMPRNVQILISGNWQPLPLISKKEFDNVFATESPLSSNKPTRCAIFQDTLYVDALSDDDYTIRILYYKQDASLPTNDSDTSLWFDEGYNAY